MIHYEGWEGNTINTKCLNFESQIPDKYIKDVEICYGNHMTIFKPKAYMGDTTVFTTDYHISLPSTTPPTIYINGKECVLNNKKLLVVNPGEEVVCTNEREVDTYYSILIKPVLFMKVAEELDMPNEIKFRQPINPYTPQLIQGIINLYDELKRTDKLFYMVDCIETQIVITLLRDMDSNIKKFNENCNCSNFINKAKDYINTFYSANISIDDICNEIHVSKFHFIRTFNQKTGISPHQYLLSVRIKKAEEFLRLGQYTISEVALLCGFVNLPHFSNTFKSVTGYSPSEYCRKI